MSAASQTAFSRSISTNSSGKKKRLQLFQRHGSPTSKKRPASEIHRKTSNGFVSDKDKARYSTQISGTRHEKQSSFSEIESTEQESYRLHLYSSREVADELCLMDGEILRKIDPSELHNGAWMKKEKDQLAPNVLSMVRASNELAMMVPSEILEETSTHGRAKVISSFIKIASKLHRLRNYNSLKAVLAGLQCTPIFRLKKTWKEVPSKRRKKFEKLSELMSEEYNWKLYRAELETCFTENLPCIPFLGVLLTTIVQQESATTSRGVKMSRNGRKRVSGVEMYTILEAITVRNRLEKLRKQSSAWRLSGIPAPEVKRPTFIRSKSHFSKDYLVYQDQDDITGLTLANRLLRLDEVNVTKTRKILVGDSSGSEEDEERLLIEEGRIKEWIENNVESAGMGMENENTINILDHIGTTSSSDSETTSPILPPRCRVHAVKSIYSKKGVKKISADEVLRAKMSDSSEPDVSSCIRKSLSESLALDEIMSRFDFPAEIPELFENSDCSIDVFHSSGGDDPVPNRSRRDDTENKSSTLTNRVAGHAVLNGDETSVLALRRDSSGTIVHSDSADRLRKVTVLEPPAIEQLYDAHLSEYAEVSRSLESLKEACDDLINGPLADDSPELIPKRQQNGELAGFVTKSLSLQSLSGLDDSLKSHSDSSLASSSSHSDTIKTGPASLLNVTVPPDNAFEELDRSSITDDLQELDSELLSSSRDNLPSNSVDDVFTALEDNSNSGHVILRRRHRNSDHNGAHQDRSTGVASRKDVQETDGNEHRPRLNSRAERFRKSSYGPVRRRSRRKASLVLRLAQLGTDGRQFNQDDHLLKYKFVSLRYSTEFESNPELRALLMVRPRNTEAQNYKLSYEREA